MPHPKPLRRLLLLSLLPALLLPACSSEPPPDPVVVARTSPWPPGTVLTFEAEMDSEPLDVRVTGGGETTERTLSFRQREEVEVTVGTTQLRVRIRSHVLDVELDDGRRVSHRGPHEGRDFTVQRDSRGRAEVLAGASSTYGFTGIERFVGLLDPTDGYPAAPVGRGEPGEMEESAVDPMLGGLVELSYGAASVELLRTESRDGVRGAVLSTYHLLSGSLFGTRRREVGIGSSPVDDAESDLLAAAGALSGLQSQMELTGELFRALEPVPHDADYLYSGQIEMEGDLEHRGVVYTLRVEGPVTVRGGVRMR